MTVDLPDLDISARGEHFLGIAARLAAATPWAAAEPHGRPHPARADNPDRSLRSLAGGANEVSRRRRPERGEGAGAPSSSAKPRSTPPPVPCSASATSQSAPRSHALASTDGERQPFPCERGTMACDRARPAARPRDRSGNGRDRPDRHPAHRASGHSRALLPPCAGPGGTACALTSPQNPSGTGPAPGRAPASTSPCRRATSGPPGSVPGQRRTTQTAAPRHGSDASMRRSTNWEWPTPSHRRPATGPTYGS